MTRANLRDRRRCMMPCDHGPGPNRGMKACFQIHPNQKSGNTIQANRRIVLEQSGGFCELRITFQCTEKEPKRVALGDGSLQVDHWIPFAQGGYDGLPNLVASCPACNNAKNDRPPEIACVVDGGYKCVRRDGLIKIPTCWQLPSLGILERIIAKEMTCALFVFAHACPPCHAIAPVCLQAVPAVGAEYDYVFIYVVGSEEDWNGLDEALNRKVAGSPAFFSIDGSRPRSSIRQIDVPQSRRRDPDAVAHAFLKCLAS